MRRTSYCGSIGTGCHDTVEPIIRSWLASWPSAATPHVKIRIFGSEITYEDAVLSLYCYENSVQGAGDFLLEGHVNAPPDAAVLLLGELVQRCAKQGFAADIDYVEVDEDDTWIGEELTIRTAL
ncbi:hypothetical protein [Nocardia sp. NPDC050406]|uniref:hypothetical protein n=1 Tax=Nocardia sp. NPDC050406 TaxID=3364318 RepID=UPI00379C1212